MKRHLAHLVIASIILSCSANAFAAAGDQVSIEPLWSAAVISDTQTDQHEWLLSLLERIREAGPDMVIHTGDTQFERSDGFAIRALACLLRSRPGGMEFHLAPGNHDMRGGLIKSSLRRAATEGLYRYDRGVTFKGQEYALARVAAYIPNPVMPAWNPEIISHPAWQVGATVKLLKREVPSVSGSRYVFKRGRIRFIVCDWDYSKEQSEWIRDVITRPDDSSVSIVLHHYHSVSKLSRYFKGLEGKHNVKLVLMGHDHSYDYEVRDGITYIRQAGIAHHRRDCDSLMLNVYKDHLRLDRYLIPNNVSYPAVLGPEPIWVCEGQFSEYERPRLPRRGLAYVEDSGVEQRVFYEQSK